MKSDSPLLTRKILTVSVTLLLLLAAAAVSGLSAGPTPIDFRSLFQIFSGGSAPTMLEDIVWRIRLPRVLMAALVGGTLSLGGLVFQAILRNPLAEPYILGISGGSAIGAILGILMGLSPFPGIGLLAFAGSMLTLGLILAIAYGENVIKKDSLLLAGVMVNAFCSAIIMFLISMTHDSRLHNILFWLMGDLSLAGIDQAGLLAAMILPCFVVLFFLSGRMNLLMLGNELAQALGVNIKAVTIALLVITSFMVSATVSQCGLLGFVGLVMPHLLRLIIGPDHRVLVPACILGGGAYMVICDLLARVLPDQGEMPAGVITAMLGAPLFIYLLKRSKR